MYIGKQLINMNKIWIGVSANLSNDICIKFTGWEGTAEAPAGALVGCMLREGNTLCR